MPVRGTQAPVLKVLAQIDAGKGGRAAPELVTLAQELVTGALALVTPAPGLVEPGTLEPPQGRPVIQRVWTSRCSGSCRTVRIGR